MGDFENEDLNALAISEAIESRTIASGSGGLNIHRGGYVQARSPNNSTVEVRVAPDMGRGRGGYPSSRGRGFNRGRGNIFPRGSYTRREQFNPLARDDYCNLETVHLKEWTINQISASQDDYVKKLVNDTRIWSYNFVKTGQIDNRVREKAHPGRGAPPQLLPWSYERLDLLSNEDELQTTGMDKMQMMINILKEAIDYKNLNLEFQKFDFITSKRALNRMFRICNGEKGKAHETYKVDIERVGNILIMDKSQDEDSNHLKFLNDLLNKMTKPARHDYGKFTEVRSFEFGSLKILIKDFVNAAEYHENSEGNNKNEDYEDSLDSLASKLGQISLKSKTLTMEEMLDLTEQGKYDVVELMSCSTKFKNSDFSGRWPNMFFSGAKKQIILWQTRGLVRPSDVQSLTIDQMEHQMGGYPSEVVAKMHKLLVEIRRAVNEPQNLSHDYFSLLWSLGHNHTCKKGKSS